MDKILQSNCLFIFLLSIFSPNVMCWGVENPCSQKALSQGKLYHPHPFNPYKFIQCDEWGGAYIVSCPQGYRWLDTHLTCVKDGVTDASMKAYAQNSQGMTGKKQNGLGTWASGQNVKQNGQNSNTVQNMIGAAQTNSQPMQSNGQMSRPSGRIPQAWLRSSSQYGMRNKPPGYMRKIKNQYGQNGQTQKQPPMNSMQQPMNGMQPLANGFQQPTSMQQPLNGQSSSYPAISGLQPPMNGDLEINDSVASRNPYHLVPCRVLKKRYLPHPSNPQKYYECVYGYYKEKECRANEMWDQQSSQCREVVTSATTTEPTTSTGKNGYGTPCMEPGMKYRSFAGDTRKYIVCHGPYSWEVLWCGKNEMWVQNLSKCMLMSSTSATPTTTTTVPTTTTTKSYSTKCKESKSYYLPYEEDPAKYIQCDEFGNAYLRVCGPEKLWDDSRKTCVGNTNIEDGGNQKGGDYDGDYYNGDSDTSSNLGQPNGNGETQIITFTTRLQTSNGENGNLQLDPVSMGYPGQPVAVPYNTHPCPHGMTHDPHTGECFVPQSDYNLGPSCDEGYLWDTQMMMCIKATMSGNGYYNTINVISQDLTGASNGQLTPELISYPGPADTANNGQTGGNGASDLQVTHYNGQNPCADGTGYYFPYPDDQAYYIQCDNNGNMNIMPCHPGLIWNQDYLNCIPVWMTPPKKEQKDTGNDMIKQGNPCKASKEMYIPHETDPQKYIMCSNSIPFEVPCPYGTLWDNSLKTCA